MTPNGVIPYNYERRRMAITVTDKNTALLDHLRVCSFTEVINMYHRHWTTYVQRNKHTKKLTRSKTRSKTEHIRQRMRVRTAVLLPFLQKQGRTVERALGDGNCLFRSLSLQLTGTQDHHIKLRKAIAKFEQTEGVFEKLHKTINRTPFLHPASWTWVISRLLPESSDYDLPVQNNHSWSLPSSS